MAARTARNTVPVEALKFSWSLFHVSGKGGGEKEAVKVAATVRCPEAMLL